jgi:hypothetical protein
MTDDPQDSDQSNEGQGGGGGGSNFPGGGGGGLLNLLPLLLGLFRGKGLILLLVIVVGGYFFMRNGGGCNLGQVAQQLATGGLLNPDSFKTANVQEPPTADDPNNPPLPENASLQKFAPNVGNQGQQGSCVAWSSAYAARSILESARTGQPGEQVKFSPSFLYNQIGLEGCQGSYIARAMEFMTKNGSVPYDQFQYTDQDCSRQPDQNLQQLAQKYKMRGFNRLTKGDDTNIDLYAIKQNLAAGAPVAIGMMVGQSFMQPMLGKDVWQPEQGDESLMGFGGHAMCVVGYDDKKYGGAFLLMNSWGPEWGNNGFAWIRYSDFKFYVREAYGLDPMQRVGAAAAVPFTCDIGLMEVEYQGKKTVTKGYIPLRLTNGNRFSTVSPMKIGAHFKMEIRNSNECYIYVFGKETDGTSYTLFPYPTKEDPTKTRYSPFCGISGYRLFPKDKSMTPDSVGTKDEMAVVISRQELDWNALNQQISQNPQSDFGSRLNTALSSKLIKNVTFQSSDKGTMQFKVNGEENQVVATIVSIEKQ